MGGPGSGRRYADGRHAVNYTAAIGHEICEKLADGWTLKAVCREAGMPDEKAVREWANTSGHPMVEMYRRAREIGYLKMADDLIDIVDDGSNDWVERETRRGKEVILDREHVQRSALRAETRRWLLSKALPRIYGDKSQVEVSGEIVHTTPEERQARIDVLLKKLKMNGGAGEVIDGVVVGRKVIGGE